MEKKNRQYLKRVFAVFTTCKVFSNFRLKDDLLIDPKDLEGHCKYLTVIFGKIYM